MTDSIETGRILVRNLSTEVLSALSKLASKAERSLEAEARQALKQWVEDHLNAASKMERTTQVSRRLHFLMDEIRALRSSEPISPSRVAAALDFEHASQVESWFAGEEEPSFKQLETLAQLLGANRNWLQYGEKSPFIVETIQLPRSPAAAVHLLKIGDNAEEVKEIILVRSDSQRGELTIVCRLNSWKAITYRTHLHISEEIGGSGEAALAWFFLTLKRLHLAHIKDGFLVSSYLLDEQGCSALGSGSRHALNVLKESKNARHNCWWEDIWDEDQYPKHEYWPGWKQLARRINDVVASYKKEGLLKAEDYKTQKGTPNETKPKLSTSDEDLI